MEAVRIVKALAPHGPRSVVHELGYHYVQRPLGKFRPWFATKLPAWLVTDALTRAGVRMTDDRESVTDIPFMTVYERWFKAARERKPARS